MTDTRKQDEGTALAHWTYSRDEWRTFQRWEKMKKSFFHYIIHRLTPNQQSKTPGITITANKISIDGNQEPFHEEGRRLRKVNIRDAGEMNVMEISYESPGQKGALSNEIRIPVPKGKLREAIGLQERLSNQINEK
jgi:hypothetical protein